ncbi:MAG TPA: hypothetical protein VH024_17615 [Candidatus Angelobacter sp.]|nr:hypothetical protein [Candidatus Angelobacter sp.]
MSILAWHFVGEILRNGDPIPPDGEWLEIEPPIVPCERGFHGSRRLIDALQYAPGTTLCYVECDGEIIERDDKLVSTRRRILWRFDATDVLRQFARQCALDVAHLWNMPDVMRKYLETGDESKRFAALVAARTAGTAADATWAATWAAQAAVDAAGVAARVAARATAAAARVTAWAAADAVAYAAARATAAAARVTAQAAADAAQAAADAAGVAARVAVRAAAGAAAYAAAYAAADAAARDASWDAASAVAWAAAYAAARVAQNTRLVSMIEAARSAV